MTLSFSEARRAKIDDAAADWLMRREDGMSAREQAAFERWVTQDLLHRQAFDRLDGVWSMIGGLEDDPEIAAWAGAFPEAANDAAPDHPGWWNRWGSLAAAACAVLALGLGVANWRTQIFGLGSEQAVEFYRSNGHQRVQVALSDGSHVTLDADSRITVRFSQGRRSITLDRGRAYFQVAHDTSRPFVVTAGPREVVAVGTEFDVMREGQGLTVALSQGKVLVRPAVAAPAAKEALRTLHVGEELHYDPQAGTTVKAVDMGVATSWREGVLTFNEMPLSGAVQAFNRYASRPLVLANADLGRLSISGTFTVGGAEEFARTLGRIYPVEAHVDAERIVIAPKSAENQQH